MAKDQNKQRRSGKSKPYRGQPYIGGVRQAGQYGPNEQIERKKEREVSRKEGKKKEGGRKSKQFLNCTAAHPDRNSASAQPMPKHRKFTKRMPLQHQTEPQHITQNKSHPHEVNLS